VLPVKYELDFNVPEDGILYSYSCKGLKSYTIVRNPTTLSYRNGLTYQYMGRIYTSFIRNIQNRLTNIPVPYLYSMKWVYLTTCGNDLNRIRRADGKIITEYFEDLQPPPSEYNLLTERLII
jgi:hypothetical protein